MEAERIDLKDFVQTGQGSNGYSYDSISDPSVMVKMYNPGYDLDAVLKEWEVAKKVWDLGVPSPRPGELVTDGQRTGLRFRKIEGKRSFARALADEPQRIGELTVEFARWCKKLHTFQCPTDRFTNAKDDFLFLLSNDTFMDNAGRSLMEHFIRDIIPDCTTAVHGDMHFGNVLTTLPKGAPITQPHDVYFIDLGYFGYGCPLMDLGMTYIICKLSAEEFLLNDFHFGHSISRPAWGFFRDEYFFGPEKLGERWFGRDVTPAQIDELMKPYALLKLLLVEYNCHFMPPAYHEFVGEALKIISKL